MSKDLFMKIKETNKRISERIGDGKKEPLKEWTMRDMMRTRRKQQMDEFQNAPAMNVQTAAQNNTNVDPDTGEIPERQLSSAEQKQQEDTMSAYFDGDNLTIRYEPIVIYGNNEGVFWAGTVDGQLKFAYMVSPDESSSGVKIERSPDFDPSNPDNQKIEKKIIDYYDSFYEYWSKNELEK